MNTACGLAVALLLASAAGPPTREWVPKDDVLKNVLDRVQWRMSVEQFRKAFQGHTVSADKWTVTRGSFRNELTVAYPNTNVVFEFSGTIDRKKKALTPASSSLVGFTIVHPIKEHPSTPFRRPP